MNECISFELRIGGKVCKLLTLYRSPSQNRYEFETFLDNLELNFGHMADKSPYLMVALGEFTQNQALGIEMTARILKDQKLTF